MDLRAGYQIQQDTEMLYILQETKRLGRTCRNPSDGINKKASIERLLIEIRARSMEKKTTTKYVELTRDYQGQEAVTTFKSKGIKEGNSISRVQEELQIQRNGCLSEAAAAARKSANAERERAGKEDLDLFLLQSYCLLVMPLIGQSQRITEAR